MSFYHGKNHALTYSATQQPTERFDLNVKSEVTDVTNALSSGYGANLGGVIDADASLEMPYNGSAGITPGGTLDITFATGGGGPSFTLTMRNASTRISTAVRNQVARCAAQFQSTGTFTFNP